MYAFKLIQLIETRAEPLSEGLMRKLKKNDRCIELLRRVPSGELRSRPHEIYRNLNDWLRNTTESEIEERYGWRFTLCEGWRFCQLSRSHRDSKIIVVYYAVPEVRRIRNLPAPYLFSHSGNVDLPLCGMIAAAAPAR